MRKLLLTTVAAGAVLLAALPAQRRTRGGGTWAFLAQKYDKDKDGQISWKEYARDKKKFTELDSDGDGVITQDDLGRGRGMRRGNRRRRAEAPKRGQPAPDFDLPLANDAKKRIKLSSFTGKRPVALIFGSYT